MMAWGSVGVSLPHSSRQQFSRGQPVAKSALQSGDLVFFYSDIHHVGLYAGNGQVSTHLGPASRWSTSRCPTCPMPEPVGRAELLDFTRPRHRLLLATTRRDSPADQTWWSAIHLHAPGRASRVVWQPRHARRAFCRAWARFCREVILWLPNGRKF